MFGRVVEILPGEAADTAAVKTIDLNITEPISRIAIQFKGTNNNSVPTAHPAKMISKIELVDGSDVLYSLSGIEAQALDYYHQGKMSNDFLVYSNDIMAIPVYFMHFGRFLWDKQIALDPKKFTNLQLKITHNKANGGSTPDAGNLKVFGWVFGEGEAQPDSFFMQKEIFTYSLVNSAVEFVDLPIDHTYRKLMIQSLAAEKAPYQQFNKLKLGVDHDKKIIIGESSTSDLSKMLPQPGKIVETIRGIGTGAAVEHFVTPSFNTYLICGAISTDLGSIATQLGFGGSFDINTDTGEHFQCIVQGTMPHGALSIPFGRQNEHEDWLKVNDMGSLQLKITAGSSVGAGSTCEVIGQQHRKY